MKKGDCVEAGKNGDFYAAMMSVWPQCDFVCVCVVWFQFVSFLILSVYKGRSVVMAVCWSVAIKIINSNAFSKVFYYHWRIDVYINA